ncbi:MAG: hypothetical protein LBD37_10325 [Treponema sp.]|jgi:hypothetical protein|nr:hypothetical protein [Treponema sp.]
MAKPLVLSGIALFLALAPCRVWGVNLEQLCGAERARRLLRGETLLEAQFSDPRPMLLPNYGFLSALASQTLGELDPSILVENLSLYRKPGSAAAGQWSEAERAGLYNRLAALSSLAGIQYFSTSRNRMRTFYETSTVIDGPDTKNPQPDPVYQTPPAALTLYARQKDLTFGDHIYRYTYRAQQDGIIFFQENLTPLYYGIIPAAGKGKLRSLFAVIDAGPYLLIYAASMAKAASIPGMRQRLGSSFSTRSEAVVKWFSQQADRVFAKD